MFTELADPRRHRVVVLFCKLVDLDCWLIPPKVEVRRSESFVFRGYRYESVPKVKTYSSPTRCSWARLVRVCEGQMSDLGDHGDQRVFSLDKRVKEVRDVAG